MINPEDDPPRPGKHLLTPPPLDMLGVTELTDYITVLEGEIARVKAAVAAKDAHRNAAAAFFRK